jgi:hypothetical protein
MAQHRFETEYNINFKSTSILDNATRYMDHIIIEAIEIGNNEGTHQCNKPKAMPS